LEKRLKKEASKRQNHRGTMLHNARTLAAARVRGIGLWKRGWDMKECVRWDIKISDMGRKRSQMHEHSGRFGSIHEAIAEISSMQERRALSSITADTSRKNANEIPEKSCCSVEATASMATT